MISLFAAGSGKIINSLADRSIRADSFTGDVCRRQCSLFSRSSSPHCRKMKILKWHDCPLLRP